jgi:polyribonucleotide nucleotidyltransferase
MKIDIDKIGALIGPGGKNVKSLCEQFSVRINTDDDGTVTIYGRNSKDAEAAREAVHGIVSNPETGKIYQGVVKRIMEYGAFIDILPGKEGLLHISKLSRDRIENVTDVIKEGQEIAVKLMEVDKMGRMNLSYIDAIDPQPDSGRPNDDRGGGGFGSRYTNDDRGCGRNGGGGSSGGRGNDRGGGDRPRSDRPRFR